MKLSNFALNLHGQLQLIDFSGSALHPRGAPSLMEPVVAVADIGCMTAKYCAPDLSSATNADSRADVYSAGAMIRKLVKKTAIGAQNEVILPHANVAASFIPF